MKKFPMILIICPLLPIGWILVGGWHELPLLGKLKVVTVTMHYFSATATNADGLNILEKTVTIQGQGNTRGHRKILEQYWA